ncbi:MAG: VRR-NUC domain-containing protein [bacterium]|nr:VRR-NUC domain-containing protein [bacterium]
MTEAQIQSALIKWARALAPKHPCLAWLFAIPNGGARGRASRMGAGMVPGMPDLFLPAQEIDWLRWRGNVIHSTIANGLFIELKTKKGRLSQAQLDCHVYLESAGYRVEVCRSVEEAQAAILDYLGGSC